MSSANTPKTRSTKHISGRQQKVFLDHFRKHGNATLAAEVAGFDRRAVLRLKASIPEFARAWADAEAEAADRLEAEAHRRAVDGVERFVVSAGRVVTHDDAPLVERYYSDSLLMALLRARSPDKFADRKQFTGKDGGPIKIVSLKDMSEADLLLLASEDDTPSDPGEPAGEHPADLGGESEG